MIKVYIFNKSNDISRVYNFKEFFQVQRWCVWMLRHRMNFITYPLTVILSDPSFSPSADSALPSVQGWRSSTCRHLQPHAKHLKSATQGKQITNKTGSTYLIHRFIHSFVHAFTHTFILSCIHSLRLFVCSFIHSFIHSWSSSSSTTFEPKKQRVHKTVSTICTQFAITEYIPIHTYIHTIKVKNATHFSHFTVKE